MKRILCFLVAILLIFAVSCNSDNPNPDSNIPEVNTDYSDWTEEKKLELVDDFQRIMFAIYSNEASDLEDAAMAEVDKAREEGKTEGRVIKSNEDKSLSVVVDYYWEGNNKNVSIVLNFNEYEYGEYTIWGFSDEYDEYIFKNNDSEVTKLTVVELEEEGYEYYLNDQKVEYVSQQS